jgi:DNA integrity scanning protein DisA with diadenylate cyclase activity
MSGQRMLEKIEDTTLSDHLLDHFATWYVISVVAIQALEKAREAQLKIEREQTVSTDRQTKA